MASFLETHGVYRRDVKRFVLTQADRLKDHARQMAAAEGRPYQYFGERTRKEDLARGVAECDGIMEGLVCVFTTVEPVEYHRGDEAILSGGATDARTLGP